MKQFCMKIDLISQGRENVLFLPSNMAAVTSHENSLYIPQAQVYCYESYELSEPSNKFTWSCGLLGTSMKLKERPEYTLQFVQSLPSSPPVFNITTAVTPRRMPYPRRDVVPKKFDIVGQNPWKGSHNRIQPVETMRIILKREVGSPSYACIS